MCNSGGICSNTFGVGRQEPKQCSTVPCKCNHQHRSSGRTKLCLVVYLWRFVVHLRCFSKCIFSMIDGSSSIGTSGTWGGLVKMAVYNSTYFPNCDVLAGTSLQTGTPGVIGTYNAASKNLFFFFLFILVVVRIDCPIFITSDVTGTAVGTKFTQGACSFYVRSMPFAPNPSQDNNWVERFSFQCDGLMRRYKGNRIVVNSTTT